MDDRFQLLVVAALGVSAFFSAAKTHGRQVRLEREAADFHHVVFGGKNPAGVEAIWARDRRLYWPVAGVAALLGLAAIVLAVVGPVPRLAGTGATAAWAWFVDGLLSLVAVPMIVAFLVAGGASVGRTRREHTSLSLPGGRHTLAWWTLTSLLVVGLLVAWALSLEG